MKDQRDTEGKQEDSEAQRPKPQKETLEDLDAKEKAGEDVRGGARNDDAACGWPPYS